MLKLLAFLLTFQLTTFAQANNCTAQKKDCSFYSCLEEEVGCGEKGYPIAFGKRYCDHFQKEKIQKQFSEKAKFWLDDVAYCLEKDLERKQFKSCSELAEFAYEGHAECYKQTGFCNLNLLDRIFLLYHLRAEGLDIKALKTYLKVRLSCI